MQILVDNEIDVNYSDGEGWNALQFLCRYYPHDNLIEIINILRERGIDTKLKLENGWSALQTLCQFYPHQNLIDIIQILISEGIDIIMLPTQMVRMPFFHCVGTTRTSVCSK